MRLDHLLGHEEPEARAADVDLGAVLGPREFLEEARQDFRRDAHPGVSDFEYEPVRRAVERERCRDRSGRRVFHGIVDDIGDDLLQFVAVGRSAPIGAVSASRRIGRE